MKKLFVLIMIVISLIYGCDNPQYVNNETNTGGLYLHIICLNGHEYYYRGGHYSILTPLLNDDGTPVKCKE